MKIHLPHGLRAALMAAIASVSLTIAYGAAPSISGQYAIDWSKVNPDRTSTIQGANIGTIIFSPTISSSSSWYAPSTNSKYTGYAGTDLKYINVVRSETEGTTLGDVYFDMEGGKAPTRLLCGKAARVEYHTNGARWMVPHVKAADACKAD